MTINYESYGMPTSITDPNNNTTTLQYDANHHGELTSVSDPLGNSISVGYDDLGRPVTLSGAKGKATAYT